MGSNVSGVDFKSLLSSDLNSNNIFISGGSFGLEGSVIVIIVIFVTVNLYTFNNFNLLFSKEKKQFKNFL